MIEIGPLNAMSNVYSVKGELGVTYATKNMTPGFTVYGEKLFEYQGTEYREWMHTKSKLASGFKRGIKIPELKEGIDVLYLGASSGTTVSHISDMIGKDGNIFAIEFAPKMARGLINLSNMRKNIYPIIADARYPSEYTHLVHSIDFLYCDVAQPNQSELFLANADAFLKKDGLGYIAIKARSISQRQKTFEIIKNEIKVLEAGGFENIQTADISRIHKAHSVFLGKW